MTKPYVCVFDLEHDQGRIIQFAGILFKNVGTHLYQICKSINTYIKQPFISDFIAAFSHLDEDFIQEWGVEKTEFLNQMEYFFTDIQKEDVIFISHGVHQDMLILKENDIDLLGCEQECTYELAKKVLPRNNHLTVNDIASECGCVNLGNHNAYGDALTTACILSFLLKKKGELAYENAEFK